jgi:hypothetical protein
MTDEQDRCYEMAVRHDADTIDSERAHDLRYLIAKLDVERNRVRELQQAVQNLSCRALLLWHSKEVTAPKTPGWYYVRHHGKEEPEGYTPPHESIRYYDDYQGGSWWLPTSTGMRPNNSFDEWLDAGVQTR